MGEPTNTTVQPADVRVNRANILRRIGRLCFATGEQPALPAPERVNFFESLHMTFDTAEQVEVWAARFQLDVRERVYKPKWQEAQIRSVDADGKVDELGGRVHVSGWTTVADPVAEDPEDTDPDDLEAVQP